MPLGPVMLGLDSLELSAEERELLIHPLVGGVILFSRNYQSVAQITSLITAIHALRQPPLLIAVDHEGGRVQRFREGFTILPPARRLGEIFNHNPSEAKKLAHNCGSLLASELRAVGIDFSFAPVLDLDHGCCPAIGDRALHRDPEIVAELAHAVMLGMRDAGMAAVGKHFPGHGAVNTDSHHEVPVDHRSYADIAAEDLIAFERMIHYGLPAIMPAHVVYAQVDPQPAGFSRFWLQTVLRRRLEFQGAVFSDDLDMAGAAWAGDPAERAQAALNAGCDMLLACNDRRAALAILDHLQAAPKAVTLSRLTRLHGRDGMQDLAALKRSSTWQQQRQQIDKILP